MGARHNLRSFESTALGRADTLANDRPARNRRRNRPWWTD
jgi:hypothetical protein